MDRGGLVDSTPSQKIDVDLLHLKDMRDGICHDTDDALAYPWRADFKNGDGAQITVRTVPE